MIIQNTMWNFTGLQSDINFTNGVIIQWGIIDGLNAYSTHIVTLPLSYKDFYFPFTKIKWKAQENTWYSDTRPVIACAMVDIDGAVGFEDKSLSSFNIPSFSSHFWITIGI